MKSHKEYLVHAEQCERLAASANLELTKIAMLVSAAMWRKLAADEGTRLSWVKSNLGSLQVGQHIEGNNELPPQVECLGLTPCL